MEDKGSGWLWFAGIMLLSAGIMRFFDAIWAFNYHGQVPQNLENALFGHSLSTYGWIYLVVAGILVAAGLTVVSGSQIARWTGVVASAVAMISAIWWMPYYPIWALTYIGLGMTVMYALLAYGGRPERATRPSPGAGEPARMV